MDRRNFLMSATGRAKADHGIVQLVTQRALEEVVEVLAAVCLPSFSQTHLFDKAPAQKPARMEHRVERWLHALDEYDRELRVRYPDMQVKAIAVPFACEPLHFYVREPRGMSSPDLTDLRQIVEQAPHDEANAALLSVYRPWARKYLAAHLPESVEVPEIKKPRSDKIEEAQRWQASAPIGERRALMFPDRIITPAYGFNIDKAELTNGALAYMLVCSARGIVEEGCKRRDHAVQLYQEGGTALAAFGTTEYKLTMEHAAPEICMERKGVMVTMYAWLDGQGVVTFPDCVVRSIA